MTVMCVCDYRRKGNIEGKKNKDKSLPQDRKSRF